MRSEMPNSIERGRAQEELARRDATKRRSVKPVESEFERAKWDEFKKRQEVEAREAEKREEKFFEETNKKMTELKVEIDRLSGFYVYGEEDGEKYGRAYPLIGEKEVDEIMKLMELSRAGRDAPRERLEGHRERLNALMKEYEEIYLNQDIIKLLKEWEQKREELLAAEEEQKRGWLGKLLNSKKKIEAMRKMTNEIGSNIKEMAKIIDDGLSDHRDLLKEITSSAREYVIAYHVHYLGDEKRRISRLNEELSPLKVAREHVEAYVVETKVDVDFLKLKKWYEDKYGEKN